MLFWESGPTSRWPTTANVSRTRAVSATLDTEVPDLALVNFQPIHEAAVAATLKTQWDSLKQGDETARLLLRVAGQFAEAASVPTNTLGLFAGLSHIQKPGHPSPLRRPETAARRPPGRRAPRTPRPTAPARSRIRRGPDAQ